VPRRGQAMPEVASTLDLAQTILARVGLAPYNGIQGVNLLPWLAGTAAAAPTRAGVVVENEPMQFLFDRPARFRVRTLFNGTWRLTLSEDEAACECYDLTQDPQEMHNLWDVPDARAQRDALIAQLAIEMIRLTETSPLPTAQA
jgi:arylsulfatase A-like enzyme